MQSGSALTLSSAKIMPFEKMNLEDTSLRKMQRWRTWEAAILFVP